MKDVIFRKDSYDHPLRPGSIYAWMNDLDYKGC